MKNSQTLQINCAVCRKKLSRKNAIAWPKNRTYPSDQTFLCGQKCKKKFKVGRGPIERAAHYLHIAPGSMYHRICSEHDNRKVIFESK